MAADSDKVEVVCPEIENLTKVETNLTCPIDRCTKIFPNSSALRMHLVKTHKTTSNTNEIDVFEKSFSISIDQNKEKKKTVYCCPVTACVRGQNSGRYFHRLAHVKQHYMNVHGEKKFICKKCEKKFGRNDVCLRHEKACGMIFPCSCGAEFNTRTTMLTHARRNGHIVPGSTKRNDRHLKQANRRVTVTNPAMCISYVPVIGKAVSTTVRPLKPKILFSDANTQTEQPCCSVNENSVLMQDAQCSTDKGLLLMRSVECSTSESSSLMQDAQCSTNECSSLLMQNIDCLANKGLSLTQDKGVTVDLCKHTQTAEVSYLQSEFITDEQFDVDFNAIDNEDFKELTHSQTQTNWDLAFENFPLFEDNETQTLESYLELDPSNVTIDCATQTKSIFDEIFSVDTETQTLLQAINFDEEFGGLHCNTSMDEQTQTLPLTNFVGPETASLGILQGSTSNVETQTAFNMHLSQSQNVKQV